MRRLRTGPDETTIYMSGLLETLPPGARGIDNKNFFDINKNYFFRRLLGVAVGQRRAAAASSRETGHQREAYSTGGGERRCE